jgi:hypothetical protein
MASDNGFDAWGRRSFDGNNQAVSNFFSGNTEKASKAFALASKAQTQNGYGLTNSTSHFNPTVTDPHHAFPPSSNRVSQAGNNFATSNPSSGANINSEMPLPYRQRERERDPNPYYYANTNTTFINDLSNNPWQPSPAAFPESSQYRSQQNIVNGGTPASV